MIKFRLVQDGKIVGYEKHILSCGTISIMHRKAEEDIWYYIYPTYEDWIPHNHKDMFTGLKDKSDNSNEVYKDDLLGSRFFSAILVVDQITEGCNCGQWIVKQKDGGIQDLDEALIADGYEIIGNKWNNPELLE